jgi:hypothetical protein
MNKTIGKLFSEHTRGWDALAGDPTTPVFFAVRRNGGLVEGVNDRGGWTGIRVSCQDYVRCTRQPSIPELKYGNEEHFETMETARQTN